MQVGPLRGYNTRVSEGGALHDAWTCLRQMVSKEGWRVRSVIFCKYPLMRTRRMMTCVGQADLQCVS